MNSRHTGPAVLLGVLLFVFVPSPGLPQGVVAPECPACVFGPRGYERATSVPITEMVAFVGDPACRVHKFGSGPIPAPPNRIRSGWYVELGKALEGSPRHWNCDSTGRANVTVSICSTAKSTSK